MPDILKQKKVYFTFTEHCRASGREKDLEVTHGKTVH